MFENMERLSKSGRVKLRRAAGKMIHEVDAETISAFYTACHCKREYEEKAFLAACLLAGQDTNGNTLLAKAWKEHIEREKSASLERRMIKLLDMQWDGNYASALWRIVKMLDRMDIDYEKLVWDIIHWDDEDRNVQKNWLRMIYSEDEIKVKEEK